MNLQVIECDDALSGFKIGLMNWAHVQGCWRLHLGRRTRMWCCARLTVSAGRRRTRHRPWASTAPTSCCWPSTASWKHSCTPSPAAGAPALPSLLLPTAVRACVKVDVSALRSHPAVIATNFPVQLQCSRQKHRLPAFAGWFYQ